MDNFFKLKSFGPLDGCTFFRWSNWRYAVPVYIGLLFSAASIGFVCFSHGRPRLGLFCVGIIWSLALLFIAPFCGLQTQYHEGAHGMTAQLISTYVLVSLLFIGSWMGDSLREKGLKPGGWLSSLVYKKLGRRTQGIAEIDWFFVGPLNDFKEMSPIELFWAAIIIGWLILAGVTRYNDLMTPTLGIGAEYTIGNSTRAVGRAFAAVAQRLLLLSILSPSRNVVFFQFMQIPFERAIKWHKVASRMFLVFVYNVYISYFLI
jgi:hypothetical protein